MLSFLNKTYAVCSDEELMAYVVKGHHPAFEQLYIRYSKPLLRFFYRQLYQDEEKAQDFLQDLFLKVIEKADLYHPDKKFKIWIYAIASNMCKNEYRKNEVRGCKVMDFDFTAIMDKSTSALSNRFDQRLFNQMLVKELEKMDDLHRLTFAMRYQDNLSVKEISEVMECAEGTVKSRLFYSLKKLNSELNIFNPYKETK
ncbi:RNA polymerase sigma factor [Arcticibacter eurypsychrophilus]|uniref:RNA polymerase sigma factor n=1 Tax=Arcticibacter eurypsychrophilus TaxID=1434752 RepID=UPI00084D0920|nr:sigma-70 family RNA polymerase sigma factor [Arcticibacter eurypsychrophilus]